MLWHLDGVALDDIIPVPKAQPGRHFSTGHHVLGNPSANYDVKYAQMTYGDHYRKKVEVALEQERQRCADILAEQKKKASAIKTFKPLKRSSETSRRKTQPGYDLNELRHHQRRCAALLFGARERGPHKLPLLVQWAPKRRESYYLMSERVYNDRLLMKLKADAGDSPINFDFGDTDGNTDNLHEFQKFINKTSKDIKGMRFDTEYNDYTYDFNDGENRANKEGDNNRNKGDDTEDPDSDASKVKKGGKKVVFSDYASESDTDAMDTNSRFTARSEERVRQRRGELDPDDIELRFVSDLPDERQSGTAPLKDYQNREFWRSSRTSRELDQKGSSISSNRLSSPDLLSLLQGSSRHGYSSDFTAANESEIDGRQVLEGNEDDKQSCMGGVESAKDCKHVMRKKTQDYYKKLPKLLKTSELRAKLPPKARALKLSDAGQDTDHHCMAVHKTAYERALTLARFRTLPFSFSFLAGKINNLNTFSYFSKLPSCEKVLPAEEEDSEKPAVKRKTKEAARSGREAIFGNIDMDDFYNENDELMYFIRPEELKTVVASTVADGGSSKNSEESTLLSATTSTSSRSNSLKR